MVEGRQFPAWNSWRRNALWGALLLASIGGVGCGDTTEPRFEFVASVRPLPDSVHLEVGEAAEFSARAYDEWGNPLPDRAERASWSLFNPSVAELEVLESGGASVKALAPGEASVQVELGRGRDSAPIFVPPPGLDRFEIVPSPVKVSVGGSFRPRVRLLDADGQEMDPSGFRTSWEMSDTTIARIPPFFNPRHMTNVTGKVQGQTRLKVVVGGEWLREDVVVILEPVAPDAPAVTPASPSALELVWSSRSAVRDGYRVRRAPAADGTFEQIGAPGRGSPTGWLDTTFVDAGLQASTTYYYRILACNEQGCSDPSETGSGATPGG